MIKFNNISQEVPYSLFKEKYLEASGAGQKNIEASAISSFAKKTNEVDSRYVNIKYVNDLSFIFFSNYNSKKANQFFGHKQVSMLFFWNSINTQIRIKAHISRLSIEENREYFSKRNLSKNALSISSNQSKEIKSYDEVLIKYNKTLNDADLKKCPEYWGGYSLLPYEFEFWKGHKNRLNKRNLFRLEANRNWENVILEP